ncbi:OmpP1/FadL family transporter [sulfur-oxidizing endosymbiont of Gigantopelta aegis]|uniref:OmpP1/FadL family transporter n=1 Tax=sulfur-oxidizing endosymbiont of Gigantopelta aegis TaxID=2794934 RepID=UPI0018DBE348|nr:outer membrane protein transport protein [sulfur-oxidizing endosymbiont of Gigantopelta aegis]
MIKNRFLAAAVTAAILLPAIPTTAMATNGMFMMGNGTKANGRAGVGIAMADSAISGADNPAAMVRVGNRFDMGIQIFDPDRTATITGNGGLMTPNGLSPSVDGSYSGSDDGPFYIPEGGFNYMISDDMSVGLIVVGAGGMNTSYSNLGLFNAGAVFGMPTSSGINLEQIKILPTLSYKVNENHSIGVSLVTVYQQFKAMGLG